MISFINAFFFEKKYEKICNKITKVITNGIHDIGVSISDIQK